MSAGALGWLSVRVRVRRTCPHCDRWCRCRPLLTRLDLAEVDEDAAVPVVAVVGEVASAEPLADGGGLDASGGLGGVGVEEDGVLHQPVLRRLVEPFALTC